MEPNQHNQQSNSPGNQPASNPGAGPDGAWDFLYNQPDSPKKESFFSRYKKLIIIAGSAFVLLIALGVVATFSSNGSSTTTTDNLKVPTTTVPTMAYDGKYFSMNYASSLKINIDEALEDPEGWFLHFAEDPETFTYDISVQAGAEEPAYEDGTEAIEAYLYDSDIIPSNVVTSGVVLAGSDTTKTVGEYSDSEGKQRCVVYASVETGGKFVIINGTYPKDNQEIVDSFDAMIGSIKLK